MLKIVFLFVGVTVLVHNTNSIPLDEMLRLRRGAEEISQKDKFTAIMVQEFSKCIEETVKRQKKSFEAVINYFTDLNTKTDQMENCLNSFRKFMDKASELGEARDYAYLEDLVELFQLGSELEERYDPENTADSTEEQRLITERLQANGDEENQEKFLDDFQELSNKTIGYVQTYLNSIEPKERAKNVKFAIWLETFQAEVDPVEKAAQIYELIKMLFVL